MTNAEKKAINKLLNKVEKDFSKAESSLQQVTVYLHKLGYDYEASRPNNETVFLKHGAPFAEVYNLDDLEKEQTK